MAGILRELDPINLGAYPDCGEVYRKLARWLEVSTDSLILTPGSDGVIRMTFEAFIDEGDKVVHTAPTFAMYSVYCQMFGARVDALAYEKGPRGPSLSVERILAHLDRVRPRLFCLPNPDSPTGTVLCLAELRAVVELCARIDTVVLIDEAYHPFHDATCILWTREFRHLVVARTFAKAWGLAGLRVGYAVGHPDILRYFHKLRPMYEVSTIGVAFIERVLDHVEAMTASVRRLNNGKRYFVEEMTKLGFDTLPTHGNFQHVAFGEYGPAIHAALSNKVVYRVASNDPCLAGYSRFTVAPDAIMAQVVGLIKQVVANKS